MATAMLTACEENSQTPPQPQATLPSMFVDSTLQSTWQCDSKNASDQVTGQVRFEDATLFKNTDIVHVTLLKRLNGQHSTINTYCINNIDTTPVTFTLMYDDSDLETEARYFVSATYFHYSGVDLDTDLGIYDAVQKSDGEPEVISNGIFEQIEIRLRPL